MRLEIGDDAGQLLLDGELLPGLFDGVDVEGSLDVDQQQVPGASDTSRQVQGYKPAAIVFKFTLPTDDESSCFEKLELLTSRFKRTGDGAEPMIRRIVSEHTARWGIEQVIFISLRSSDDSKTDTLKAELRFEEWKPSARRKEAQTGGPSSTDLDPELQALLGYDHGPPYPQPSEEFRRQLIDDVPPYPD